MRLTVLLTAALLMVAACDQQTAPKAGDAAAPAAEAAPDPVMPADAPPQEETVATPASTTADESCTLDQGSDGAMELVRRCMAVSTASHPPCNPNNPCKLIQDEIDRACAAYKPGETKPAECAA